MAMKDWFGRRTALQLALQRGTQPGADLANELRKLDDYSIKTREDGKAICDVLQSLAEEGATVGGRVALNATIALFEDLESTDCPAYAVMTERGLPILLQIVENGLCKTSRRDQDDVLFGLRVLAIFGTRAGTDAVIRAARQPLRPDDYWWGPILRAYTTDHAERERLFKELADPLPTGFLAMALLDSANTAHRDGATDRHPFDSVEGCRQLEKWFTDKDEEHHSYAISAAAALPFISSPDRERLLAIAFEHVSPKVQIEAAWAAAKSGSEAGIKWLTRCCLDINHSELAKEYLRELGRADAVPAASQQPEFQAKAAFAQWLAHPNELGRPPDELEIIDHRRLNWPPIRERKPFWLLKYRVKDKTGLEDDDVGVGLFGSVTFCFFTYELDQRPPEDVYAIHCYWEMERQGLIAEVEMEQGSSEYSQMLRQATLHDVTGAQVILVADPSPDLHYPQKLVGLAKARRPGETGWLVLDGPRTCWYAASEMPADVDKTVLRIHVGRVLLGFEHEPDRRKYLRAKQVTRAPHDIVAAYERLLALARSDAVQAKKFLGNHSVLGSKFADYADALAAIRQESKAICTCRAYEALLSAGEKSDPALHSKLFDSFSPLGRNFDAYVDALVALNRSGDILALIEKFRSHWKHNWGYGTLGGAAFKAGDHRLAEPLLVKLREGLEDWCRSEEMNALAEIWHRQGRIEDAHALLIDALRGLIEQSRTASGGDRKLFEEWFQDRRSAYLRLFPERGEAELQRHRIPRSTLQESA